MPQPYNLTNMTSATNLLDFMTASNQFTGNLWGMLILMMIYIIPFVALKGYYTKNAFFASAGIAALSAMPLFLIGWISQTTMFISFILLAISMVWLWID